MSCGNLCNVANGAFFQSQDRNTTGITIASFDWCRDDGKPVALDCPTLQCQRRDDFESHTVTVLEERGLFWWHGEPVPDTKFAAEASVLGLLSIGDDGVATLALDGCLPSDKGPMAVLSRDPRELKGKLIEGILSTSSKHVLLLDLARHGGHFRTHNLSHDGYRAIHCLVSDFKFPNDRRRIV